VICGSHHGIRVRGSVFTLARARGQLPHLRHDALAVPLADRADRDPRVDHPRLELEAGGDETEGSDCGSLRQSVVRQNHAVRSHAGVAPDLDITLRGRGLDPLGHYRDQVVHEVVARAPHLDPGRETAEVADPAMELCAPGDAAPGGDVRAASYGQARRDVAEVVDDRVLSDHEMLGDSNADVRGDDRQGCDPTTPTPVSATG